MPSILVVCSANMCRSPMAEALLTQIISKRPDAGSWKISSAGTWARGNSSPTYLAQYVMTSMGLDISDHLSRSAKEALKEPADLILTMESGQKEALTLEFPHLVGRIYMLSEMVGTIRDIPDPVGGELEDYQETVKLLQSLLEGGLERIVELASQA